MYASKLPSYSVITQITNGPLLDCALGCRLATEVSRYSVRA